MPLKIYRDSDTNIIRILGSLDVGPDTNPEKIAEMFQEYMDKIGVKNADIRVWDKDDLSVV